MKAMNVLCAGRVPAPKPGFPAKMRVGMVVAEFDLQSIPMQNGFELGGEAAQWRMPDVGVVVGAGNRWVESNGMPKPYGTQFQLGDKIVCQPASGLYIDGFEHLGWKAENTLRWFGSPFHEYSRVMDARLSDEIIAKVDGLRLRPVDDQVLIAMAPLMEKDGLVWLPDGARNRDGTATVLEVGPLVEDVKPGDRVVYSPHAKRFAWWGFEEIARAYGIENERLAMIREDGIFCVLE